VYYSVYVCGVDYSARGKRKKKTFRLAANPYNNITPVVYFSNTVRYGGGDKNKKKKKKKRKVMSANKCPLESRRRRSMLRYSAIPNRLHELCTR
jgi:hypothetical protein